MDDVEYLNQHGKDQTFVFLADSAQRDASVYPSPAEYSVSFNAPFRNVVGFELLEVNIPRSDYLVDSKSNVLTYSLSVPQGITTWTTDVSSNVRTANFASGDYNLPQLIKHMNDVLANVAETNGDSVVLQVSATTVPSEISNKIRFDASGPFCILANSSSIASTIGLGDPVSPTSHVGYSLVPGYSVNAPRGASGVYVANVSTQTGPSFPEFVGPLPGGQTYQGIYGTHVLREYFTASQAGIPTTVSAYLATIGTAIPAPIVNVRVAFAGNDSTIATGVLTSLNSDYDPAVSQLAATQAFVAGTDYYVEFTPHGTTDSGNCAALWYNVSNLPPPQGGSYAWLDGSPAFTGRDYCTDVSAGAQGYELLPPGLVNLRGVRYIKIRCPELEQFVYRDRVGEPTTAGVGMVDLIGYGFQNQRYGFVHYPATKFHPIGRIQKLTLRLERPDGSLYDANGVDNTMLCALTYKVVPKEHTFPTYPAAPGYDPDFIKVQQRRWRDESEATYNSKKPGYCYPASSS